MSAERAPPVPFDVAQDRLMALCRPLGTELIPSRECLGRYTRAGLAAERDQPALDLSAMDGYALCGEGMETWRIVGESAAGRPYPEELLQGEAVRISTGAPMPRGGERIVLKEDAIVEGNRLVTAPGSEASARHIRRRGLDFHAGDIVLGKGVRIGPAQLALVISAGFGSGRLTVGRLPGVAVIDSGNELSDDPITMTPSQIPASNGVMLAAMAAPFAASVKRIGPVADTMEALADALDQAGDADVVVTSGGASIGDHDLVRPSLDAWGARLDFWRIAMKPGKPLLVARRGNQLVLGLPGNPVSSFVTAWMFLLPVLRRLAGAAAPLPEMFDLPLAEDMPAAETRTEFVRGSLTRTGVAPLGQQDSSALGALARADVLIRRDANAPEARAGEMVGTYWLQTGGIA
ncbi:molybdopterin molybdotransferase MoeA [Aurantiacibacter spongiae]|uniref:Molybdopterin molybdenumtransferase n=1 Tax=Aurantiacibacter spongiae TaxID=2488860 RepID=A0A3N5CUR3_9SPHN|nr:molybdopterin molybdotransferase MoeA [Aurantiacibacter spongiae]RPF70359.1 molybdopterin molybdenumtransferase MoeA [Aurantiacibacter spongiae]